MDIVTYPNPLLLKKTVAVTVVDDAIRARAKEMLDLMHRSRGVGLAAPQVGWSVRLLVLNAGEDREHDEVLIDPVIKKKRGRVLGEEGCLSFPGIYVQVERAKEIEVEFTDITGARRTETRSDFVARIVQHEIDHLDNILLLHRMTPADRVRVKRELESLADRN